MLHIHSHTASHTVSFYTVTHHVTQSVRHHVTYSVRHHVTPCTHKQNAECTNSMCRAHAHTHTRTRVCASACIQFYVNSVAHTCKTVFQVHVFTLSHTQCPITLSHVKPVLHTMTVSHTHTVVFINVVARRYMQGEQQFSPFCDAL